MQRTHTWLLAAAVALAAACSGAKSNLSISARAGAPLKAGATAAPAAATTVTVDTVHFVIRKLELKGVDASGKEIEAHAGPINVDLSGAGLNGTPHSVSGDMIPTGDYTQLEMEIGDIEVTGTDANGSYDFKTSIDVEQEVCGTFHVGADQKLNFTVNVDISTWFTDPTDSTKQLNPSDTNNRHAIEENIERSFEVFEDADENGQDDDCECESSDHGGSMTSSSSGSPTTGCSCSTTCAAPQCVPLNGACTSTSDCCNGSGTVSCAPAQPPATGRTCQSGL